MLNRIRAALRAVVEYLIANPGASSLIAGEVVLYAARVGLHVTMGELSIIAAILVPLIAGGHVASHSIRMSRASAPKA